MPCPNYYKRRMRRYVGCKLRKMFTDIHEMYNSPIEGNDSTEFGIPGHSANIIQTGNKKSVTSQKKKSKKWKINIAQLLDERLPSVLSKNMVAITSILNMDPEYKITKATLLVEALRLDPSITGDVVISDLQGLNITPAADDPAPVMYYFAKVEGMPDLPPRNLMRPFLYKFSPTETKLHKIFKNLLYVTFRDKDKFQNFLSHDGVTIGDRKLKIQVSSKVKPNTEKNNENVVDLDVDSQPSPHSNDNADLNISSDLDNKIDDLLSSIRRDEEAVVNENPTEQHERDDGVSKAQDVADDHEPIQCNDGTVEQTDVDENDAESNNATHNNTESDCEVIEQHEGPETNSAANPIVIE